MLTEEPLVSALANPALAHPDEPEELIVVIPEEFTGNMYENMHLFETQTNTTIERLSRRGDARYREFRIIGAAKDILSCNRLIRITVFV